MKTVERFKATKETHRWNQNQNVWIRFKYANHLSVWFKWRGRGRYVSGQVDRFNKSVGKIESFPVEDDFAARVLGVVECVEERKR